MEVRFFDGGLESFVNILTGKLKFANRIRIFRYLLDEFGGAAAAFFTYELSTSFVGQPIVRVRRSSDDTEQNFTATEITDGTLTTFTGAGDGFVVTWYDQSGNGRDATQATAGSQPQIVASGALVTENSDPAIDFGPFQYLETSAVIPVTRNFTWYQASNIVTLDSELITSSGYRLQEASGAVRIRSVDGSNSTQSGLAGTYGLFTAQVMDSPNARFRFNGGAFNLGTNYTSTPTASTLRIGRESASESVTSAMLIYPTELADRELSAIEAALAETYGITLAP